MKQEQEVSFNLPGIGFVKYVTSFTQLSHYLGKEGGFYKFKITVTDMKSDNYVDGIRLLDQYWLAMEDNPCYIYSKIDGNGLIDHIKPIIQFNLNDPLQQRECFHWSNLQPLWASANQSKGAKIIYVDFTSSKT